MTSDSSSQRSRWVVAIWRIAAVAIWTIAAIDFVIRDRFLWTAMVYYAAPTVFLAVTAACAAWLGKRLHRSRVAVMLLLLLAVFSTVFWVYSNVRIAKNRERVPNSIRVAFWNVGRGWFDEWDQIAERLNGFDADVLVVAEATSDELGTREYWRTHLPGYFQLPLNDGFVLLVRGQATLQASDSLATGGQYRRVDMVVRGVHFHLILADITSDPWLPRRPPLDALWEIMKAQTDQPALVLGDFNTPPSSVCFDRWRGDWTRAWDAAGSGYQPTWPQPVPILPLDHLWGNRWIRFHSYRALWSRHSDHRPVVADFTVASGSDVQNSELAEHNLTK